MRQRCGRMEPGSTLSLGGRINLLLLVYEGKLCTEAQDPNIASLAWNMDRGFLKTARAPATGLEGVNASAQGCVYAGILASETSIRQDGQELKFRDGEMASEVKDGVATSRRFLRMRSASIIDKASPLVTMNSASRNTPSSKR
jgi:hypothetical protein